MKRGKTRCEVEIPPGSHHIETVTLLTNIPNEGPFTVKILETGLTAFVNLGRPMFWIKAVKHYLG